MTGPAHIAAAPIRVAVVDDSPFFRVRFAKLFGALDGFLLAGVAGDGEEAIRLIAAERPDVVVLDLNMPRVDGFAVLRWAMASAPLPIVVCSSLSDRESVFRALDLGAVDFVTKPERARGPIDAIERHLVACVRAASGARVGHEPGGSTGATRLPKRRGRRDVGVVAIAASTGGPAAIQRLARGLPDDLSVPIVVAQHMPAGFTSLFAERLGRQGPYAAVEARDGLHLRPRTIHVAPGGMQLRLERAGDAVRLSVRPRGETEVYAPSADVLFASAAEAMGASAVGVILTGMGDDGSRGTVDIRRGGGYVLAESSDSALIYGMPGAAVACGGTDAELPLDAMPDAIAALARGSRHS